MPHPPGQLPTTYRQPFGTKPAIFLWKERHRNADGFLPIHGQETGKIRVFAHDYKVRVSPAAHTG
jgi:hypothetical protein